MDKTINEFETCEEPAGAIVESYKNKFCECEWIKILDENTADAMKRPVGNYITIKTNILEHGATSNLDEIAKTVSDYLVKMMDIANSDSVLVVGIGNRNAIADSLGVRVAEKIWTTRHIVDEADKRYGKIIRPVSAITPGVTGVTGISISDIIKSICDKTKPSLVILVDAMAAGKTLWLNSSIQIRDTGITPSSGICGKKDKQKIDYDFLGVPVISIGVPTVMNAATIIMDAMSLLHKYEDDTPKDLNDYERLDDLKIENIKQFADKLFLSSSPFVATMEIDAVVNYSSYIISTAINNALFQEEWMLMSHDDY